MRVLGIGREHELADLYMKLRDLGHEVRVYVHRPECHDIYQGTIERVGEWKKQLGWVGKDGLFVFENADLGAEQDALRRAGHRVVGGSAFGDRLENDRAFGQAVLRDAGLQVAATHPFDDYQEAYRFVAATRRRFVLKPNGANAASHRTYVGMRDDAADMLSMLELEAFHWNGHGRPSFVLMEHLDGVEVGVGAWFSGDDFVGLPNLDWEHKRFFPGDVGEMTGEMGTVATYRGAEIVFEATLARLAGPLRAANHRGYVNLDMIANEQGIFPLELTCRFGYPGFAVLAPLQATPWDELLARVAGGPVKGVPDSGLPTHDGISVGVVLTVPPFPYIDGYERLSKGAAIHVDPGLHRPDALHFTEVRLDGDQLVAAGAMGYLGVATGVGSTLEEARADAYAIIDHVAIPNLRYRDDIGLALERSGAADLARMRWIDQDTYRALAGPYAPLPRPHDTPVTRRGNKRARPGAMPQA